MDQQQVASSPIGSAMRINTSQERRNVSNQSGVNSLLEEPGKHLNEKRDSGEDFTMNPFMATPLRRDEPLPKHDSGKQVARQPIATAKNPTLP